MSNKAKKKAGSITSDVPEEETGESYPIYKNNGTINVTVSGNNNVITFLSGQAPPPPKPGGH